MMNAASPDLTDQSSTSSSSGGGGKKKVTIVEEENIVVEAEEEIPTREAAGKVKIDLKTSRIKSKEEVQAERLLAQNNAVVSLHKVKLERVLGLTVPSNAGLASSPATGIVAYPAGCTVVLYNPRKNRQTHVTNLSRKTITSVGFSEDGRYLVTGECGHLPNVRIWDVHEKTMVAEFSGHKFGINCVAFAPNNKYVVSVGSQHDMIVNVWDWKNNVKVASNKISTKVKAISFSENGNYFVTAGNRHVKFWYLEYSRSKYKDPMPLMGRSAILGEQRNNYFCDVSCGRGEMGDSTYAITKSGLLCEFNNRRLLDKWVELRTQTANCLSVGEDYVFIGCGDGIIRCFSPHTLQFITTLPRTHYLGVDVSKGLSISHMATHPPTAKYPDAKAITYDEQNFKVTVVYNDHSIYVWDVRDIKKVGKSHSFIFHSACIWGLEIYSSLGGGDPGKKSGTQKPVLPPGSFITCSSDDTIRIWNLSSNMSQSTLYRRNIYSDELLKTLYVDSELNHIKELDNSNLEKGCAPGLSGNGGSSGGGETVVDQRNGVRCIRISPDGKHLASGDRAGNIRVHDLQFMDEICKIEAHDAEVLCLEYCGPIMDSRGKYLLASASRDRLIHIFNATRDYKFLTTLDDHSSSITAVKFLPAPHVQMVSCGADKSIIFRDISVEKQKGLPEFSRGTHVVGKTTLYDMEVDHNAKHILTACQDRNIRIYTVGNGKHLRTFKGSVSDDGTLIKVVLDSSGLYAATSCTDKTLAIYDYYSGECMATMFGHSELVTGLKFTEDCKHLISVSGDGCIFIWRLPHEMTANMIARLSTAARKDSSSRIYIGSSNNNNEELFGSPPPDLMHPTVNRDEEDDSYRFSVGKLPFWAKKQMTEKKAPTSPPKSPGPGGKPQGVDYPKGRWAQRVGSRGMTVKSHYDSDSIIPFPQKFESDAKDQSSYEAFKQQKDLVDEGFDYNSLSEVDRGSSPQEQGHQQNHLKDIKSQRSKLRLDALPSHLRPEHEDADIDEYSDGLTTQDDGGESTEPEATERTMYFGQSEETPSVYTVNAMDVEELRRSQRRSKKGGAPPVERAPGSNEVTTTPSVESDSEDSEDEEDEVSTPSADKNILSLLSVSSENVDLVGRRERFLKSNFESLGTSNSGGLVIDSNSFSNQYREGSALQRNASTIARAQSFRDNEQNRKREELQRRIEETKRKLQNIGYRSMIKGSQSISDLSTHIPEKDFSEGSRPTSRSSGRVDDCRIIGNFSNSERREDIDSSGLRRTCSLSDLNKPSTPRRILPAPPATVSGKKSGVSSKQHWKSHPQGSGSYAYHSSSSSSLGGQKTLHGPPVLSERPIMNRNGKHLGVHRGGPEFIYGEDGIGGVPSYMRSTSASVKKEKSSSQSNTIPRRKASIGQMSSVSTSDLRKEGGLIRMEDSSSEENSERKSSGRRRSSSQDRRYSILRNSVESGLNAEHRARSERDLSKVTKVKVRAHSREDPSFLKKNKMKSTTLILSNSNILDDLEDEDHNRRRHPFELSREGRLVDKTTAALESAAEDLVQCYKTIAVDYELNDNLKTELLGRLSKSASSAQQTLSPLSPGTMTHGELASAAMSSIKQILSKQHGPDTTTNGHYPSDLQSNPYFLHMMQNYSNMMQPQSRGGEDNMIAHRGSSSKTLFPHPGGGSTNSGSGGPSWC